MNLIELLDRPIAFHRCLVEPCHGVKGALLLSQAIYWQNRCQNEDGFWWKTHSDWYEESGLKRREFEAARNECGDFLEVKRKGVPAKCWYRVNLKKLEKTLDVVKLDCTKRPNWMAGSVQSTIEETTSETSKKGQYAENPPFEDPAINLLKAFRERFPHLNHKPDAKMTRSELSAASCLVASATVNEILELAGMALADKFAGNRRCASSLELIHKHFHELRAQFVRTPMKIERPWLEDTPDFPQDPSVQRPA